MRIIGIVNQTSGSCYHRVYTPLMLIESDSHITNKLTEEQLEKGCDILNINRFAFYNKAEEIFELRKKYGFKLVIDIDDFWELNTGHILYENWHLNNVPNIIIDNLINADAVTCTHDRLAERIYMYNQNVHVLPNAIPSDFEQFKLDKLESDKIRIMWQGSITHRQDVELLRNPMKRVSGDSLLASKIKTVFGGHVRALTDSDAMLSAFTNSLSVDTVIYPGAKPTEYYSIYNDADIAIIPLVDNRFNMYKSNLKVLEAAHAGIPVVVSNVNPYLDFPDDTVLYVNKQSDWYNNIKMLVSVDYSRKMYGEKLKAHCDKYFNFDKINNQRLQIFKNL